MYFFLKIDRTSVFDFWILIPSLYIVIINLYVLPVDELVLDLSKKF